MHEPTYRQALGRAWKLVAHHKTTWMFGILAALLGQWGIGNLLGYFGDESFSPGSWWPASWGIIHIRTFNEVVLFAWLFAILAAVGAVVLVAAVCAEGALIATSIHWYNVHRVLPIKTAWRHGANRFWSLFGVALFDKAVLMAVVGVTIMLTRVFSLDSLGGLVATIFIVALGIFSGLAISSVTTFAAGYAVADGASTIGALAQGWHLFRRHVLVSLELSLLLLFLNAVVLVVIFAGAVVILAPSVLVSIVAGFSGYVNLLAVAAVLYTVLFAGFIIFVAGVFNAFTISAWMYLFMKMHHEGIGSRIIHYARKLVGRS